MAKSLKIQIEMAGAEEIKRQLEGVGEAGEQAFNKILGAAKDVGGFKNLDPSFLKETYDELGTKAPEAIGKITQAVKSASRMETLVNALTGVENGLVKVQAAASALDAALGKALLSSITKIARVLPAAFAAATVGAIANTTQAILELDAAAIKLGVSAGELAKLRAIFQGLGISTKDSAKGVDAWQAGVDKIDTEKVQRAAADMKKFGVGTTEAIPAIWKLQEAEKGRGEAAALARKILEAEGLSRKTADEEELSRIQQLKVSRSEQMLQAIALFERMGNTIDRNRLILATFGQEFGTTLIQALNSGKGIEDIKKKLAGLPPVTEAAVQAALRLSQAWEGFKTLLAEGFTVSPEGLQDIATILGAITTALQAVGTAATWVNEQLRALGMGNLFQSTIAEINQVINLLGTLGQAGFAAMKFIEAGAIAAWQTIIGWINTAIEAVKQFFSMGGGKAAGAGAGGMARGGLMGGRGTGTSDSNLAWLSRGEHVMPARAVAAPGVLAFLEALRRSGGNLRGVLDRMGHFAMGGMVSAPAFARGGSVGGMSNVTIQFPGVQPITGLRASSAVVDELRRSAALAQVRSGGRKPSRYT